MYTDRTGRGGGGSGVRVRSFMEASPKRHKKILFERLFSCNKKINALTEVKESQY